MTHLIGSRIDWLINRYVNAWQGFPCPRFVTLDYCEGYSPITIDWNQPEDRSPHDPLFVHIRTTHWEMVVKGGLRRREESKVDSWDGHWYVSEVLGAGEDVVTRDLVLAKLTIAP